MLTDYEGCLSAPGKQGEVKRYLKNRINYKNDKGQEHTKTFYNLEHGAYKHEMDHLDGKLCIDYEKSNNSRNRHKSQTMVESDFRIKSNT